MPVTRSQKHIEDLEIVLIPARKKIRKDGSATSISPKKKPANGSSGPVHRVENDSLLEPETSSSSPAQSSRRNSARSLPSSRIAASLKKQEGKEKGSVTPLVTKTSRGASRKAKFVLPTPEETNSEINGDVVEILSVKNLNGASSARNGARTPTEDSFNRTPTASSPPVQVLSSKSARSQRPSKAEALDQEIVPVGKHVVRNRPTVVLDNKIGEEAEKVSTSASKSDTESSFRTDSVASPPAHEIADNDVVHLLFVLNDESTDSSSSQDLSLHEKTLQRVFESDRFGFRDNLPLLLKMIRAPSFPLLISCVKNVTIIPEWFIFGCVDLALRFLTDDQTSAPRPVEASDLMDACLRRPLDRKTALAKLRKVPFLKIVFLGKFLLERMDAGVVSESRMLESFSWISVLIESHFTQWVLDESLRDVVLRLHRSMAEEVDQCQTLLGIQGQISSLIAASSSTDTSWKEKRRYWFSVLDY